MVHDLSNTNNQHLKGIYNGILKDGALEALYGNEADINTSITRQRATLKEIFKQISDNDVSAAEKKHLEAGAKQLADKLETLKKKMDDMEAKIADKQDAINKKVEEIADLVTGIKTKSEDMENKHRVYVTEAIKDVFDMYSRGTIEKDNIGYEIRVRLRNSNLKAYQSSIESDIINLNKEESAIQALIDDSAGIIDDRDLLRRQFGVTKSSYELIEKTLGQIGNTGTNYKNSDSNTNVPIYSIDKTSIVSKLFDNEKYNVLSTNSAFKEGSTPQTRITQAEIKEKYKSYLNVGQTTGDPATSSNASVQALSKALNDENFINDLKQSSMSNVEIAKFMAQSFGGTGISCDNNGRMSVPYGHDGGASATYNKLVNFINTGLNNRYFNNTWDKDQGNSVDTNAQIKALGENYEEIFKQLATGEPQFSFKEAMYALFNKNSGLFKNCGINYDLSKQGNGPYYTMDGVGDEKTAKLYTEIANSIEKYWGVKVSDSDSSLSTERTGSAQVTSRTDPLSFITETADGRKIENTFILDHNQDGKFSDYSEFLGASDDWLKELTALAVKDEEGHLVIQGDNLSKLKILSSEYTDNASVKKDGKFIRETNNNIDYRMTDAKSMGIEKIDITDLVANNATGKKDINNSVLYTDNFKFTMNGKEYTATRKDDTNDFMNAVYKDAKGKNFQIGHSEGEIDAIMDKNYGEVEDMLSEIDKNNNGFFGNVDYLKNFNQLRSDTKALYAETNRRIDNDDQAQLKKADNKAMSFHESSGWSAMVNSVRKIALQQNINAYDEEVIAQLKGIYVSNTALDAYGVVDQYKQEVQNEVTINKERETSSIAWEAIIKAFKEGISTTASEVKDIIENNDVKNADEVIEILKNKNEGAKE